MEHIRIEEKGVKVKYFELTAEEGYCFYIANDVNRQYFSQIITPVVSREELNNRFVVVFGNADALNEELRSKRIDEAG